MKTFYQISRCVLFFLASVLSAGAQTGNQDECKSSLKALSAAEKQSAIDEIRQYFRDGVKEPDNFYKMVDVWLYFDGCRDNASSVSLKKEMSLETYEARQKKVRENMVEAVGVSGNDSESKTISAMIALLLGEDAKAPADEAIALDNQNYEAYFVGGIAKFSRSPDEALQNIDKAIALNPKFAPAYALKAELLLNQAADLKGDELKAKYEEALKTIDAYLPLISIFADSGFWRSQREALVEMIKPLQKKAETNAILTTNQDVKRISLNILSRPQAQYTLTARNTSTQGTVVLKVIFNADGITKKILIAKSLPFGLTREAIKAASGVKFTPATQDGKPISVIKTVIYTFTIY